MQTSVPRTHRCVHETQSNVDGMHVNVRWNVPVRSMDALAAAVNADLRFAQTRTRAFDGCVRSMQSPATANPTVTPAAHANAPPAEANARVRQTFARAMHAAMRASYAGAPSREARSHAAHGLM